MRRHRPTARLANVRVRRIDFLNQRAGQAGVVRQVALKNFPAKVHIAEQTVQRVFQFAIRRGRKQGLAHRSPIGSSVQRQFVLTLEVMKEAALGDTGFVADVIDCRRRIPLGPDHMQGRIQQLRLRFVVGSCGHQLLHTVWSVSYLLVGILSREKSSTSAIFFLRGAPISGVCVTRGAPTCWQRRKRGCARCPPFGF